MSSSSQGAVLHHAWAPTSFGRLLLGATQKGLCFLSLREAGALERLAAWAARHVPGARLEEHPPALAEASSQLAAYGQRRLERFDLELDLRGSEFQLAVWRELCAIPFGETSTYGELARRLGRPGASRAVGGAAGRNPVAVVVPCHRLLASPGLGGFSGGLQTKRVLLGLECAAPSGELFSVLDV